MEQSDRPVIRTLTEQVVARDNLNLRHAGSVNAALIATIQRGAIIHIDGPTNTAGYVPVHVYGYRADGVLYADSLAADDKQVDCFLHTGAIFEPVGPANEIGRTPGIVRGYVARRWTVPANEVAS